MLDRMELGVVVGVTEIAGRSWWSDFFTGDDPAVSEMK